MTRTCIPAPDRIAAGLLLLAVCLAASPAWAQQVLLDRSIRVGEITFFESLEADGAYYYAPASARLAEGENGRPQFSFLRYVQTVAGDAPSPVGEGGGLLHAVVELGVDDADLAAASGELSRVVPGAQVKGPLVFRSGRFGLVSAFEEDGELATRVVGLGTAPVLEGGRAAVSLHLTKLGAQLLWQSFQTATPDVAFLFEMEMAGYRSPQRAVVEAELDRVYAHEAFELGIATPYLEQEIRTGFDDLRQRGAIRVTQVGEDEDLEALVDTAYSKLTDLIFQAPPALEPDSPAAPGKSALERASALLEKRRQEAKAHRVRILDEAVEQGYDREGLAEAFPKVYAKREKDPETPVELPDFAAVSSYEMKRSRQRGTYRIDLNKHTADRLLHRFDRNIGDLARYLEDDRVFRSVNLDDPMYRQREVVVSLSGVNDQSFELLDLVSVEFRKAHENGDETFGQLAIDRASFNDAGNRFRFVYGWKGDTDRSRWRDYEYRARWAFAGAEPLAGDWTQANYSSLPLRPPLVPRKLQLEVFDAEALSAARVRAVAVTVSVPLGADGEPHTFATTLHTAREERSKTLSFLQPRGESACEVEIRWILEDNRTLSSGPLSTDQTVLYLDQLPEA